MRWEIVRILVVLSSKTRRTEDGHSPKLTVG